jgi:uncharacterized oligopeptide transporter (OPT) family protein
MGSAGGSLGFISNFFAARVMTGHPFSFLEMAGFSVVSSLLGLAFVVPLRDLLILRENLPWPGSRATESVIRALSGGGDRRQPLYLFAASAVTVAYVVLNDDGGFGLVPSEVPVALFGLSAYGAAIALSPFALGGAYLMGFRACVGFLTGAVILLVLAPRLPDPSAPHRYVWPGIGFLLSTGLTSLALNWRVVAEALRSLASLRASADDDDPIFRGRGFATFAAVAIAVTLAYGVFSLGLSVLVVLVLVVVGGLVQNIIATRAQAQTAFNPARVMGVLLEGLTSLAGAPSASTNLVGAGIVAGSGAQAGNLSGDLVYGRWLKVPARWQFWAQMVTVLPCSLVAAAVFDWIARTKDISLESASVAAPVAKMWAATAQIFEDPSRMPPFALEAIGLAALCGVAYVLLEQNEKLSRWMPHSIGLGIGLVLPISYDLGFFVGGVLLYLVLGKGAKMSELTLTTLAVAAVVGEGLGGVLKPLLALAGVLP